MFFHYFSLCFLLAVVPKSKSWAFEVHSGVNATVFTFHDMQLCRRNEYYDLDNFACTACNEEDENLQPTPNKFSCECTTAAITIAIYDARKQLPQCPEICNNFEEPTSSEVMDENKCESVPENANPNCKFKYINSVLPNKIEVLPGSASAKQVRITAFDPDRHNNCSTCDLTRNFIYQEYCIANVLLKPYLNYNAFWQHTSLNAHIGFGDLKFVAFFCLELHNSTACNQLANLCVMSHFSFDKNSPCSAFLLTQTSDAVFRYATMAGQLQAIRPYLFYKKGKQTAQLLLRPIAGSSYSISGKQNNRLPDHLQFSKTTYALDGSLESWGTLKLSEVNLCQLHLLDDALNSHRGVSFGRNLLPSHCSITLDDLIELTNIYGNKHFISLYLNYSSEKTQKNRYMQSVPILIESLTPENARNQPEDWQLVKRFLLIEAHPRLRHQRPTQDAAYKLQLYRSIRFVESFEIHYKIHDNNRIGIPIVKLRYRHIQLSTTNTTLGEIYHLKFQLTFVRVGEATHQQLLKEVALPVLLLVALGAALLHTYNFRKRLVSATTAGAAAKGEICDFSYLSEFMLQLISNVANALLLCTILHVIANSLKFLTQNTVEITLPIEKDRSTSQIILYVASMMKLIFHCVHFWRISHVDIFFIDWERPKSYDNNHFNLKCNLETSSVCSSVRTFVSENNVSAWRIFFTANEWISLSGKQKTSTLIQGLSVLTIFRILDTNDITRKDSTLKLFIIIIFYIITYAGQLCCRCLLFNRIFGNPLQKFVDLCSMANISVFSLLLSSFGFYIHGRSPHGFADTDMCSIVLQLQRESQKMCGKRGLLGDSDQQTYIILPPTNLRSYVEKLLIPFQRSRSISQAHFQKEIHNSDGNILERTSSIPYSGVNRFFCAFIDHAIKDMDYIIKEKTFVEKLFNCEFDNYLTQNKGTFYIDDAHSFSQLFLYGNSMHIFQIEFLLLLSIYMLTINLTAAVVTVVLLNKLFECKFRGWVRENVARKTLIDRRFLM